MPYDAHVFYDFIRISFNRKFIIDLLEHTLEKKEKDDWSKNDKKKFDLYIEWIEESYSIHLQKIFYDRVSTIFDDWFFENLRNYEWFDEIENLFEEEEE